MNSKTRRKHICLIDDDILSAKIFSKVLTDSHHEVKVFESGEDFIGYLNTSDEQIDLILLDIMMPGISGIGVLKFIRQKFKAIDLPVIMLTAKDEAEDIVEALELGANDYITKPANSSVILARIHTQLELIRLHKEASKKKEFEAVNATITTYCHEINNPLAIILGMIKEDISQMDNKKLETVARAANRIGTILSKIHKITEKTLYFKNYSTDKKMIDLK